MNQKRPLRHMLLSDATVLSTFVIIKAPEVVELAALAGFDSVIIDLEHGPFELPDAVPLILAARARGIHPIVRVRSNQPSAIGAALDAGASGVLVPQVESEADARAAVSAAHFAPNGSRGVNPWVRAFDFEAGMRDYAKADDETAIMLLIEGRSGIAALPAILDIPRLDCVFIGPVDMSHALGFPGEPEHPAVIAEIERISDEARKKDVSVGVFAATAEAARRWIERGVSFVAVSEDTRVLGHAYRTLVASIARDRPSPT